LAGEEAAVDISSLF